MSSALENCIGWTSQKVQIEPFDSVDAAIKALAPKPQPKKIEQPKPVATAPTVPVPPDPAKTEPKLTPMVTHEVGTPTGDPPQITTTDGPLVAVDTVTGKLTEWPEDRTPTAEEQITAQAQRGTELEPLKAQDIRKAKVDSTPTKQINHHLLETMHRNIRFSKEANGCEVLEPLQPDDYVVITARDLWCIASGYPLKGVNGDQAIFQKGEVIR